jgi:uncharacterized protein (TIGR02246 family)
VGRVHWHDTRAAKSCFRENCSCYLHPQGELMRKPVTNFAGRGGALAMLVLFSLAAAAPGAAQNKKDKQKQTSKSGSSAEAKPVTALPDSQAIDQAISEVLGYWQIGDADSMHKYYADDVVVVTGDWSAPVIGWDNYVKAYQAQRAQVTGGRMDRVNTFIKADGNSAWATYQFIYTATVGGKTTEFRGHTTLGLSKRADRWVIVLNHSSIIPEATQTNPAPTANSPRPGQP